jgi:hypothetical protein
VTTIDNEVAIIRGAVLEPTPIIIDKSKVPLEGKSIEEVVSSNLANLIKSARNVELAEAERALKGIEAVIESELKEEARAEEVEY